MSRDRHLFGNVIVIAGLFANLLIIVGAVIHDIVVLSRAEEKEAAEYEMSQVSALTSLR